MDSKYFTHILKNGLRILHVPTDSQVAYCGMAVNAGSRDEVSGKFGLAHFVEHTIFKGTKHRRAWHILNRMERVGGELNAYTTKEGTMLYSIFPCEHFQRAIELLADLIANSQFPASELQREREVVMDEVNSYRDTPSEAVYDDFEDLLFAGSLLGHNILGIENDVKNLSSDDCRDYIDRLYVPENMAFFVMGNLSTERVFRMAEKYLGVLNHGINRIQRIAPDAITPFRQSINIDAHQAHTVIGTQIFNMYDERRFAMSLLNNIIGGPGMNSMFNVAIRERRGYAYTVESSATLMTDCGLFEIYFGSDEQNVNRCLKLIGNIIDNLATKSLGDKALDAAKKQYIGQLRVANDNNESLAMSIGKSFLYFDRISSTEEISERIMALSASDIMDAAALITMPRCSILTMK